MFIGVWVERKASEGAGSYFLGGNKLPWWALGASGMASNVDISGTTVAVGLIYAMGVAGFFVEIRGGIVLVMAILLAWMGKWLRRSGAMTAAEWMTFRFGNGPEGRVARGISAINELLFTVWVVAYFTVGLTGFVGPLVPGLAPELTATLVVAFIVVYATAGGFIGVIWTDVFQGGLILLAVLYMCVLGFSAPALPESFQVSVPNGTEGGAAVYTLVNHTAASWQQVVPPQTLNMPGAYAGYNDLWKVIGIFIMLTIVQGSSGSGGYTAQRYLAAKNEREAGLVALFWTLLLSLRWPMVISFAILGIHYGLSQGTPITNPESVLSTVLATQLPVGVKGLITACFLAAFMSTFSSFLNATAAFWCNDLYKVFLRPNAEGRELVTQGRLATVVLVAVGLVLGFYMSSINDVWGWLSAVLGSGLAIPLLLRWYWWRFNGWGFAVGTAFGMLGAYLFPVLGPRVFGRSLAEHELFLINGTWTIFWSVLVTMMTPPVDPAVVENFYRKTRPFGFWGPVARTLNPEERSSIRKGNLMEILSGIFALPWQLTLFLLPMAIILKSWGQAGALLAVLAVLTVLLYFVWYRNLSKES
ncbi:sodium:solute symporter [bacterium]|nr:sodium:solute symporter [bacterium]